MAVRGAELSSGGPGLMFIYLVNIMNNMAGGRIIGVIFYVCVLFAGVSSIVNLYEAPVAFLQEKFRAKRVFATAIIHIIGAIVAIFIQAIVGGWMDFVSITDMFWEFQLPGHDDRIQAGIPIVFVTALYGLHQIACLQPGERVLLHSATGGV